MRVGDLITDLQGYDSEKEVVFDVGAKMDYIFIVDNPGPNKTVIIFGER